MVVIMYIIYSYNLSLNPSESNVQFLLPRICLKRVSNLQFLDTILLKNSLRWIHRHPLTADWFELHRCPPIMKSGVRYPLTTKKTGRRGRICPGRYNFFCPVCLVFMFGHGALDALSLLFWIFLNTTVYHLGRYKPSPPSTMVWVTSTIFGGGQSVK